MDVAEFQSALKEKFPDGEVKWTANGKSMKAAHLQVEADYLGFSLTRLFNVSGGDEVIFISGSESKDGLYWQPHEGPGVYSVEDFEEWSLEEALEEALDGEADADDWPDMSSDAKVALFEEDPEWSSLDVTLDAFLEQLEACKWTG